jgi:hypothetical protein
MLNTNIEVKEKTNDAPMKDTVENRTNRTKCLLAQSRSTHKPPFELQIKGSHLVSSLVASVSSYAEARIDDDLKESKMLVLYTPSRRCFFVIIINFIAIE